MTAYEVWDDFTGNMVAYFEASTVEDAIARVERDFSDPIGLMLTHDDEQGDPHIDKVWKGPMVTP